ncbi:MAG: glycosyltransferase [Halobacteriota archaeon]
MSDKCILILVAADAAEDNGITVRGKAVRDALKHKYRVMTLFSRSRYSASALTLVLGYVAWMFKLVYAVPWNRVDCVYCCSDYFGFVSAYVLSRMFDFSVIFEAHGILSEENKAKNRPTILIQACSVLERFVISRAEHVVALSHNILEFYRKFNASIELIPVLVDDQRCRRSSVVTSNFKTIGLIGPFDMPANEYYLQFLRKHIDEFDARIRFRVIGKCSNKNVHDRITYTDYISSRDRYVAELASLDALLVPAALSTSGPLNKILEAMAFSLPVFVTPAGTYGLDYAQDSENIIVGSIAELAARVNRVIFDDAFCKLIGTNARSLIEKTYSSSMNGAKILNAIDAVIYRDDRQLPDRL